MKKKISIENLKALVVHQVRSKIAACGDYVEYICLVENSRCGTTWEIKRRYTMFQSLREEFDELFDTPHCHYCKETMLQLKSLVFPSKKMFHPDEVIQQRMIEFHAYLRAILKIISNQFYRNCPLVSIQATTICKRFLTDGMRCHTEIISKEHSLYTVPLLLRQLQHQNQSTRSTKLTLDPIIEQTFTQVTTVC